MENAAALSSARIAWIVGQSRIPPNSCGRHVTRFHKDACGVAAPLQEGVEHLVPNQPFFAERAVELDCPTGSVHRIEVHVGHPAVLTGAGYGLIPPFLIQSQSRNSPGAPQRSERRARCARCGAGDCAGQQEDCTEETAHSQAPDRSTTRRRWDGGTPPCGRGRHPTGHRPGFAAGFGPHRRRPGTEADFRAG
jgi:hypothetical protein